VNTLTDHLQSVKPGALRQVLLGSKQPRPPGDWGGQATAPPHPRLKLHCHLHPHPLYFLSARLDCDPELYTLHSVLSKFPEYYTMVCMPLGMPVLQERDVSLLTKLCDIQSAQNSAGIQTLLEVRLFPLCCAEAIF
jgi:hypothetical protein